MYGKNKYSIVLANPANNITVFVLDNIKSKDYKNVAKDILENTDYKAEQVGFVKQPTIGGDIKLEMMGGEFCGNASRSIGMIFARNNKIKRGNVLVEINSDKILNVYVDLDKETAEIAIEAGQTGHYVLSTIHTIDAIEVVTRLRKMGLSDYDIASTVGTTISQRLLRKICPHCKREREFTDYEKEVIQKIGEKYDYSFNLDGVKTYDAVRMW